MVTLICVGCSGRISFGSIEIADLPKEGKDQTHVYFVCPNCYPDDQDYYFAQAPNGALQLNFAPRYVLGRNFYDHALTLCDQCFELKTMSVLEQGLSEHGLQPLTTYLITCPICTGCGKFKVIEEIQLLGSEGPGAYTVGKIRSINMTVAVNQGLMEVDATIYQVSIDDVDRNPRTKEVYRKILSVMVDYQHDDAVLGTTARDAANKLNIAPTTARKYLNQMVEDGVLLLSTDESTRTVHYLRLKEE